MFQVVRDLQRAVLGNLKPFDLGVQFIDRPLPAFHSVTKARKCSVP